MKNLFIASIFIAFLFGGVVSAQSITASQAEAIVLTDNDNTPDKDEKSKEDCKKKCATDKEAKSDCKKKCDTQKTTECKDKATECKDKKATESCKEKSDKAAKPCCSKSPNKG